jgi:hypothetical protein
MTLHGQASRRRGHDERHVADPGHRHLHGAGDGRGREGEHVDLLADVLELLLGLDAEALLLVDDHEAQVVRVYVRGEEAMGPHEHVHRAVGESLEGGALLGGGHEAREDGDALVEGGEAGEEGLEVLLREDRRGAEDHDLAVVAHALEGRAEGHLGLAEAHVAAEETVHGLGGLHVGLDVGEGCEPGPA